MNKTAYTNQEITAYLLGALPDERTEAFDELSFTDDDFADELKIAEKDLIDAYVNNELKGENLEKFKNYFLSSPLRREKVEFAKTFQIFAEKEFAGKQVEEKPEEKAGFLTHFFAFARPSWQWGFALGLLILLLLGGWFGLSFFRQNPENNQAQIPRQTQPQQPEKQTPETPVSQPANNSQPENKQEKPEANKPLPKESKKSPPPTRTPEPQRANDGKKTAPQRNPEPEMAQSKKKSEGQGIGYGSPAKIVSFVLPPPLRGGNQLRTLSIPADTDLINLRLQLETDDFPSYRAVLQNPADNQTLTQTRTRAKNKVLNFQIPVGLLKSQIYSIEVSGVKPDGTTEIIGNYSFKVVR